MLVWCMNLKKLERYWRVNLLRLGPRLMKKKNLPGRGLTKVVKHCHRRNLMKHLATHEDVILIIVLIHTYLITYSVVQSPSWEANWYAASQEIPRISRNPKVHYHTHKRPPPVPILGQSNPVHIPTSHLLEIHPNIIHPSTTRSPQWSLSFRFPHQDPIHPLSSPIRATFPAHLILLDYSPYTYILKVFRPYSFILHILCFSVITIMAVKMS